MKRLIVMLIAVLGTAAAAQNATDDLVDHAERTASVLRERIDADDERNILVITAAKPAASEAEAIELAIEEAARQFAKRVRHAAIVVDEFSKMDDVWLSERLPPHLPIIDQHIEKAKRPYGTVYFGAIAVDASPDAVEQMGWGIKKNELRCDVHSARQFTYALSAVILIVAGYFGVNAFTNGYYTWRLRTAAVVLIAAALIVVVQTT